MKIIKNLLYIAIFSSFIWSCNQKTKIVLKGNIMNVFTKKIDVLDMKNSDFPIYTIYPNEKGDFLDTIEIKKPGFYLLRYENGYTPLYLKKEENLEMQILPNERKTYFFGKESFEKGKNNNNYNTLIEEYIASQFNLSENEVFAVTETEFLKFVKNLKNSIEKEDAKLVKIHHPDEDFQKLKTKINNGFIEMICYQFESFYSYFNVGERFKPSKAYSDFTENLVSDKVALMEQDNMYLNLISSKYINDFGSKIFEEKRMKQDFNFENFAKYMNKKRKSKIYTETILADQFRAFNYRSDTIDNAKTDLLINENFTNSDIKDELLEYKKNRYGLKIGKKQPNCPLVDEKGKSFEWKSLNGKPYVLISYASYSPLIVPILNQQLIKLMQIYKGKVNFVFVNLDNDFKQFQKTNHNLLINIEGIKLHAIKGLNSAFAKENYINISMLPSMILVDQNGNIASQKLDEPKNPIFAEAFINLKK